MVDASSLCNKSELKDNGIAAVHTQESELQGAAGLQSYSVHHHISSNEE